MTYLEKFEKNVLNDEKTFLMFMSLHQENVKSYISELRKKVGSGYLDTPQIQKIWKYYTDTVSQDGSINKRYIKDSILLYRSTKEIYNEVSKDIVFDFFEKNYLSIGFDIVKEKGNRKIHNELWLKNLLNEEKNIIKFPVASMFMGHLISFEVFEMLKQEFVFSVPNGMSLMEYFEINQGFLNLLPEEQLIEGLKTHLNNSEMGLYELSNFISKYSHPESDLSNYNNLSGKRVIKAFYSILCEENGLDYLLSLETILDDGEIKEDENRAVLYSLFEERLIKKIFDEFEYTSEKENLVKIFFILNSNKQFKEYSYTLNRVDERFFNDLMIELKNNKDLLLKLSYMTINNLNIAQLKIIFDLKDQIDLIDVDDPVLFWMEKEDTFIYRENLFNEESFLTLLTNKSYADFIVIFGMDFINYNKKSSQLFKFLNKEIENLFTTVNENKKERYQLKDEAIPLLIDFEKGIK